LPKFGLKKPSPICFFFARDDIIRVMETTESPRLKLEYNLAGGLLLTIRERDLELLTNELVSSGYRYGCVLPFRGLTKEGAIGNLQNSTLSIVHIEKAWNPTSHDFFPKAVLAGMYGYYKRFCGDKSGAPILQDAAFPSKNTCGRLFKELYRAFPGIKFISHSFDVNFPSDRMLVEINSGVELNLSEILDTSRQRGLGLVFDPSHLLAPGKVISVTGEPTRSYQGEWERQFNAFREQIEVVDINPPTSGAVSDLLRGTGLLKELAQAAKETQGIKFLRVEIPIPPKLQIPGLPGHQKGFDFLQAIGQKLMED